MEARAFRLLVASLVSMAFTLTALAHHSLSVEFDTSHRIMLTGTVTRLEWASPHVFFFIDVKDPQTGNVVNWVCQVGSPSTLLTLGWTQTTLKVGMTISLTGIVARDGSHKVNARNIVADGNRLITWPSEQINH